MKIIYTYTKIKGSPKIDSDEYTINHLFDDNNQDKAVCGFNHSESMNVIGVFSSENMGKVTCKKCLKKIKK